VATAQQSKGAELAGSRLDGEQSMHVWKKKSSQITSDRNKEVKRAKKMEYWN
jgi:hypothetical protein